MKWKWVTALAVLPLCTIALAEGGKSNRGVPDPDVKNMKRTAPTNPANDLVGGGHLLKTGIEDAAGQKIEPQGTHPECSASNPNDCHAANTTPGCNDVACCEAQCDCDPFCCSVQWDTFCSTTDPYGTPPCGADDVAACNGPPPVEDCCTPHDTPGCDQPDIQDCVCNSGPNPDAFCCSGQWDSVCVTEAQTDCGLFCFTPTNCCEERPGEPGCDDDAIESCVCAADPFCCMVEWDQRCVNEVDIEDCGTCDDTCGHPVSDCNSNGMQDGCELNDMTDCDGNDILDECETGLADCNSNGIFDACEAGDNDCNSNGVLDDCEVAGGTAADCTGNGIPDECEEDCNGNGVADSCDVTFGTSLDCQPDGVPDECQVPPPAISGCCTAGVMVGCAEDPAIEDCVCNSVVVDPYCCSTSWDSTCVGEAESFCGLDCGRLRGSFVYVYDDGSSESQLGTGALGDIGWINQFVSESGANNIVIVRTAVGGPGALDGSAPQPNGEPMRCFVLSDPNQDGDPTDAQVLAESDGVVANAGMDIFSDFAFDPPVDVGEAGTIFFVGCSVQGSGYPTPVDTSGPVDHKSWIVGNTTGGLIDWNNLGGADIPVESNDDLVPGGLPAGDYMIRAEGGGGGGDCNENGIPDDCDIAGGTAEDCDANGQIDICENYTDCDGNGIYDVCDFLADPSLDVAGTADGSSCDTGDHVLDSCQDCNGNDIVDCADLIPPGAGELCIPFGDEGLLLCMDTDEAGMYTDISGSGAALGLGDDSVAAIDAGFVNDVFDSTTTWQVGNNGGMANRATASTLTFTNVAIPAGTFFGGAEGLAPLWDDLYNNSGDVYWEVQGGAGSRVLIVQWNRQHYSGTASEVALQAKVYEDTSSGVVAQFIYDDTTFGSADDDGAGATIGYQQDGSTALQFSFNQPSVNPSVVVTLRIIDPGEPFSQDCNTNGIPDECDIAAGTSEDCDLNGVPDECQPDCNENGTPDACDILAGGNDCNDNGVPDECEDDCNGNGVPDSCDTVGGTSDDCNKDGVPDECSSGAGGPKVVELDTNLAPPDGSGAFVCETYTEAESGAIEDVDVDVVVEHTFIGDLIITVEHDGHLTTLWNRICGGQDNMDVVFDDEGSGGDTLCSDVPTGIHIQTDETIFETGPGLSAFDGMDKQGDWEICISDNVGADVGTMNHWSLHFENTSSGGGIGLIDCNENGLLDECDILFGISTDCDENGIPDECTPCVTDVLASDDFCEGLDGWAATGSAALTTSCPGEAPPCDACEGSPQWVYFGANTAACEKAVSGGTAEGTLSKTFDLTGWTSATLEFCSIYNGERGQAPNGIDAAWVTVNGVMPDSSFDIGYLHQNVDAWENRSLSIPTGGLTTITFNFDTADSINNEFLGWAIDNVRLTVEDTDCNDNGTIDQCDVSSGFSFDFNKNFCPDECEDCNNNGVLDDFDVQPSQVKYYEQNFAGGLDIPDNDSNGVTATIDVGEFGPVIDLDLALEIEHTFNGDLTVTLEHLGVVVTLIERPGVADFPPFGFGDDGYDVVLNDEGNASIANATAGGGQVTGIYRPAPDALSAFDGLPKSNEWYLTISDNAPGDTGSLIRWQLRLANAPPTSEDCNFNGVPDECEEDDDCNNSGVLDECELFDNDCNTNGIPDECELMGNDCNDNGVPDECETDCNGNGTPDDCDIAGGEPDCNNNGVPDSCDLGGTIVASDDPGLPIIDNTTQSTDITVSESQEITDVNVSVDITHTWSADVTLNLVHGANSAVLISGSCGSQDNIAATFDDEGAALNCPTLPAGTDLVIPVEALSVFDGADSAGLWTLEVSDGAGGDTGTLNSWTLEIAFGGGVSQDCNLNGIPDECDIAAGTSPDSDFNDVPDECQTPENDDCADAAEVTIGTPVDGSTLFANADPEAFFCGTTPQAPGIWYSVVGTGHTLTASVCDAADYDTKINVYTGDCGSLSCVTGNDDGIGCSGFTSEASWCSQVGVTYLIFVNGFSGDTGNFTLTVTDDGTPCGATLNEDCSMAELSDIQSGSFVFDNTGLNDDGPDHNSSPCNLFGNPTTHHDMWLQWMAPCSGTATLTTCNTGTLFDSRIFVYNSTACPVSTNALIACNDDSCSVSGLSTLLSTVSFPATSGTTYLIRVGSFSTAQQGPGQLDLSLSCPVPQWGDWDADGDTDLQDFAELQACMNQAGETYVRPGCSFFDAFKDGAVRIDDYEVFEQTFVGPHE